MLPPEKADSMRTALAFVRAVSQDNMSDAGVLLRGMLDGDKKNDPASNFANAMGVMATLLCNELTIDDDWYQARLKAVNWLETSPDE